MLVVMRNVRVGDGLLQNTAARQKQSWRLQIKIQPKQMLFVQILWPGKDLAVLCCRFIVLGYAIAARHEAHANQDKETGNARKKVLLRKNRLVQKN